jgi:hypothetical protein
MKEGPKKQPKFDGQRKVPKLGDLEKVDEKNLKFATFIPFQLLFVTISYIPLVLMLIYFILSNYHHTCYHLTLYTLW